MKSKRAEGYVSTCVMIVIICMLLSVFVTFAVAVNTVKTVKRNSRVVLDSFVMQNSIEIYNSIKQGNNKTDGIDAAEYREALTEFCTLEKRGYCYYNYDSDGNPNYTTPDTTYERSAPTGFTKPAEPTETKAYTTWWQYEYKNNAFEKVYYGIGINPWLRKETLPATGATATQNGSSWTMKSGYGLSLYDCNVMIGITGYESPAYGSGFTVPQYSYALFPEYNYQNAAGKITTLQSKSIGNYRFWIFPNAGNVENVHYTPVWYPDGKYSVKVVKSDAWTPMGMLVSEDVISNITLSGNMYDDWYVGRK